MSLCLGVILTLRHPPADKAEFPVSFKSVLDGQYVRLVDI